MGGIYRATARVDRESCQPLVRWNRRRAPSGSAMMPVDNNRDNLACKHVPSEPQAIPVLPCVTFGLKRLSRESWSCAHASQNGHTPRTAPMCYHDVWPLHRAEVASEMGGGRAGCPLCIGLRDRSCHRLGLWLAPLDVRRPRSTALGLGLRGGAASPRRQQLIESDTRHLPHLPKEKQIP